MATNRNQKPLGRRDLEVLPELLTVLEHKDDLKPKWKASQVLLVGAGAGIPYLIYDAAGGNDAPTALQLGAVERKTLKPLIDSGRVRFPYGMAPQMKLAYAQHPADPGLYIPVADYHQSILEDKIIEITRLLIARGATDIMVSWQHKEHRDAKLALKGYAPVTTDDLMTVGMEGGFGTADTNRYSLVLSGGSGERGDIPSLKWLGIDPIFQLAVDAAEKSYKSFRRAITSTQTHSVDVAMAGQLEKVGLSLGGRYKTWENVSLALEAQFPQHSMPSAPKRSPRPSKSASASAT